MNQKRQRFVEAYVGEAAGNATKAAEIAGYSPKSAYQLGHMLLKDVEVRAAVDTRQQALTATSTFTAERIIQELETVAQAKVDVKSADKMKALEMLGKQRGMFQEKQNTDSRIVINIDYIRTEPPAPLTIDVAALPDRREK